MRLHRADPYLNDGIEALDQRLVQARRAIPKATPEDQRALAWTYFSPAELEFIRGEISKCMSSRLYYLQNYHCIQPELGILTCLYPLYDHQLQVEETLVFLIERDGRAYIIVLKPRQSGLTEYCTGVMCWRTFFLPHAYTISVAQAPDVAAHIQRKVTLSYNSLPFWMQSEQIYRTKGEYMEFGRKDIGRSTDPGLGSVFITTHAQRTTGVAIGRTVRSSHLSEVSRWPDGEVWTGDIEPSMNAPDAMAFAESTAWGNEGFYYNLWEEANSGDSDWTAIFLAAYKAKKYSLPLKPSQQPFQLTPIEQAFTDRVISEDGFIISPEFWNWRRKRIRSSIIRTGFPYAHYEAYPISAQEAFQSSGQGAFPRHKLDEQQQRNICKPLWVGEIMFQGRGNIPKILLNQMTDSDGHYRNDIALEKRELTNRLYIWEQPDPAAAYYIGVDVGDGIMGGDFSVAEIFKAGYGTTPDTQVGEWVGYDPPIAFAKIVYALGFWYNTCEVAIEYAREGMSCANAFANDLQYPKIYIPRHADRTGNQMTRFLHWQTTPKTKPYLLVRMNESLLEDSVIIRSQYLLDELRRCVKDGMSFAGLGGKDDAAVAGCIAHYCMRETMPELRATMTASSGAQTTKVPTRALHPPLGSKIFGVYDEVYRLRASPRSLAEAEDYIQGSPEKKIPPHSLWSIRPLTVSKVNTAWSSIHHGRGIENELYLGGMADREITPAIVTQFAAATGRLEGMFNSAGFGAASPGADAAQWDSTLGDLGSGELGDWTEMQ